MSNYYYQPSSAETIDSNSSITGLARERYDFLRLEHQARALIDGHNTVKHDSWELEPKLNARTAIFEELTAKAHLSRVEFEGDVDDINAKTLNRLLNGWSDELPEWEKKRRFYEIVEELTIQSAWQEIAGGTLPVDTLIFTISDFPDEAGDEWAHTIGYRSLNKKGMVRSTHFEQDSNGRWHRVVEQISRSNSNDNSASDFLASIPGACDIYDTSLKVLSNQILTTRADYPNGVVDLQKSLDKNAGPNFIYGEMIGDVYLPNYDEIREVSALRESQVGHYIDRLAEYETRLNIDYKSGRLSYDQKLALLSEERTKIVNEICLLSPSYARDARGQKSGELFEQASFAMAGGDHGLGMALFSQALEARDERASAVCGGTGRHQAQESQEAQDSLQATYMNAVENRSNWKWKKGLCVINECPTRPEKTWVGPCDVCKHCQKLFDQGKKADQIRSAHKKTASIKQNENTEDGILDWIARDLNRYNEDKAKKVA